MTTIAVIADIHGNIWALDTVLADIHRRGITTIINLGDHIYSPLDPAATLQRVMSEPMINISGNEDRCLFLAPEEATGYSSYDFVRAQLTADQLTWLQALPSITVVGDIFCCHGTPDSDETYLLETVTEHGVSLTLTDRIQHFVAGITQPVILCAHTHIPRTVGLPDGRLVINPGSVGWPAYSDTQPYPHRIESGSPHARYAILEQRPSGWSVDHLALTYDWAQAAATARKHGREDWAYWLETGRA